MSRHRSLILILGLTMLMHVYVGLRLIPYLAQTTEAAAVGWSLLLVSTLLTPAGMLAPRLRRWDMSERLAWAGLLTMGLFSSLLVLTFFRDIVLLLLLLLTGPSPEIEYWSAWAVPALALLVTAIGFVNARRTARVVQVNVPIENLPPALQGYTIVQISDVHVGPTIRQRYIEAIVDRVNAQQADAIAVTGDIADGSVRQLAEHTAPLGRMTARDGVFFVTGNHEYYSGVHEWIDEMQRLGMTVLLNRHVVRQRDGAAIVFGGVPDYTAHFFEPAHQSEPRLALVGAPSAAVKVLLAHQPRSAPAAAEAGFDLQISGHTHGGQFFPWNLFVPLQQPYVAGLKRLGKMWIYISRGTGYWGPPKRFGAPSEITRITLVTA